MRSGSATPDPLGRSEMLFQAVAAAVIGGTLLAGGFGHGRSARCIGALFLGILQRRLVLKGVSADYSTSTWVSRSCSR